jgi:hypothetical protein
MLFLTYLHGPLVDEWSNFISEWLEEQVTTGGILHDDERLWTETEAAFKRQFQDVMEEERAKNTLKRGIRMQGDNIDEYISRFEMLTRQAGYDLNSSLVVEMFSNGLPHPLYDTIYTLDAPANYREWREAVVKRQKQYLHKMARKRLDAYKPQTGGTRGTVPQKGAPPKLSPYYAQFKNHPDAMDTSARSRTRLANAEEIVGRSQPPYKPRGGALQRMGRRDYSTFECYTCHKKGHISAMCPQHTWNKQRNQQARTAQAEEQEEDTSENVSRGVTQETEEEQAHQWLTGAAGLNEGVKNIILQEIVKKGDFPTA